MNNIKSTQTKALSLGASVLTLATVVGFAPEANAATFNFSFENVVGAVDGTVEGTIELPDGDGTFQASSVIITSAPTLGYTTPVDAFSFFSDSFPNINSFTVLNGMIEVGSFGRSNLGTNLTNLFVFGDATLGSGLSPIDDPSINNGVQDNNSSTLVFSSAAASTPEPSTLLGLFAVGSMGLLTRKGKQAK